MKARVRDLLHNSHCRRPPRRNNDKIQWLAKQAKRGDDGKHHVKTYLNSQGSDRVLSFYPLATLLAKKSHPRVEGLEESTQGTDLAGAAASSVAARAAAEVAALEHEQLKWETSRNCLEDVEKRDLGKQAKLR